ncbi:NAD(P)-dependent oxidoreductase [uncultured Streptomyces sp.]|uniref:NAD(P)-dependent oxidoreductase n=1 Tax=uncultured Streptomyces sp. TaxID=174707 RepID=UPI002623BB0D|nr:NAD(P)-dependent oxidoreductase [uncultured Streptomyces sp.]
MPDPARPGPLPAPPALLAGLPAARLLADPGTAPAVLTELERITGRPVLTPPDPAPPGGPYVYVGSALPGPLRTPELLWFHSVNAGADGLLGSGAWPGAALLTRTVGRMDERIAQYVLAWMLAEVQSVAGFAARPEWAEWRRRPSELVAGSTAVVHGTGRIGSSVAGLLRAVGVRTVGVARAPRAEAPAGFDRVVAADRDREALAAARWVVGALPLTASTDGFFGADRFAAMNGATFVNVGRGATVDHAALDRALRAGTVGRAVLDVLPVEPPPADDPCWRLPRTTITSHSSGITADEDVVADFAACWTELARGVLPALTVDVRRGY